MPFEWFFFLAVLVVGTLSALGWWRLAAKASPYEDEVARKRSRKPRGEAPTVVKNFGRSGSEGQG